ncbi:hypothetical protein FJU76_00620 [Acinetobacter baumannii]|nr:hypothetical protein EM030_08310 [Acinetobacter baumannii]RYL23510.1 hypothetical protein EWO64_02195 [Acinetobacter baumannii]TPS98342.1 hypothetical protein FJU76_00620 [Acinetobacter baumannii]TPT68967.1 hypothetical protein FJU61_03120 [Acinetobacter baumannii]TPU49812.1 hypothetical protein FJU84_01705 [Acinetobacter baumannii]
MNRLICYSFLYFTLFVTIHLLYNVMYLLNLSLLFSHYWDGMKALLTTTHFNHSPENMVASNQSI